MCWVGSRREGEMGFVEKELGTSDWSMAWDCDTWRGALKELFLGSWVCGGGAQLSGPKREKGWLVSMGKLACP